MKKRIAVLIIGAALYISVVPVFANGNNPAYRGEAEDPLHSELGVISYLSNRSGYHFWFTVSGNIGPYVAGHSYHNVYKVNLEDTDGWCGPITVGSGGRPPYNAVGHQGETAYYKIIDTTTDTLICP